MKLRELKKCIDRCYKSVHDPDTDPNVEFLTLNGEELEVVRIGQFCVIPDVVITLRLTGRNIVDIKLDDATNEEIVDNLIKSGGHGGATREQLLTVLRSKP